MVASVADRRSSDEAPAKDRSPLQWRFVSRFGAVRERHALHFANRWLRASKQKRTGDSNSNEPFTDDARFQRPDIDDDIRQFRHPRTCTSHHRFGKRTLKKRPRFRERFFSAVLSTARKNGGNLENAARWSERTQAGSLCYICFPDCRAISPSHPASCRRAPAVATQRRDVRIGYQPVFRSHRATFPRAIHNNPTHG